MAPQRKTTHLSGAQRIEARQQFVAPQMQRFKAFLDEIAGRYLGKGAMNQAIGYACKNWHKFSAFLTHPDLPIDNNPKGKGQQAWLSSVLRCLTRTGPLHPSVRKRQIHVPLLPASRALI